LGSGQRYQIEWGADELHHQRFAESAVPLRLPGDCSNCTAIPWGFGGGGQAARGAVMYGANVYGTVPYATFGSVVLFVAACITTGDSLAFTVNVEDQLVTVVEASIHSC